MLRGLQNTTLQELNGFLKYESDDHKSQIRQYLLLNRYREDFVANATSAPMEHWGDLLMGIEKEEGNFVVTELVRRAVEGWGHQLLTTRSYFLKAEKSYRSA